MKVKADSNISWGSTDYSEMLGTKTDLINQENNPVKAKEIEKVLRKDMTKMINAAKKMYATNPSKQYYDFLISLEMSDKALKF